MTPLFEFLGYVALGVGCFMVGAVCLVVGVVGMLLGVGCDGDKGNQ